MLDGSGGREEGEKSKRKHHMRLVATKVVQVDEKTFASVLVVAQIAIKTRNDRIRASFGGSGVVQVYNRTLSHLIKNSHRGHRYSRHKVPLCWLIASSESRDCQSLHSVDREV